LLGLIGNGGPSLQKTQLLKEQNEVPSHRVGICSRDDHRALTLIRGYCVYRQSPIARQKNFEFCPVCFGARCAKEKRRESIRAVSLLMDGRISLW